MYENNDKCYCAFFSINLEVRLIFFNFLQMIEGGNGCRNRIYSDSQKFFDISKIININ